MPAPEQLTIETPEQISLELPLAGAGSRFLALSIDTMILVAGFLALTLMGGAPLWLGAINATTLGPWVRAVLVLASFTLYYGYFAAFELAWAGQTPGKRMVGLRVIGASGRAVTPVDVILRNLLRIVDQLPGIYAVGLISVFLTARHQRLGDLAASTVVVHERPIDARGLHTVVTPAGPRVGAGRLSAQEIEAIETFLRRRTDLPETLRHDMARQLADRIRRRLELPADAHRDDETLLDHVAAEFRSSAGRR